MRLSWNEIRVRAARFADDWKDAHYEKGETQTFYNEFFEIFGVMRRKVATFEEPVKRLGSKAPGFIDLFWKRTLLVEQKSAGRDLIKAKQQALDYFPGLKFGTAPLCSGLRFPIIRTVRPRHPRRGYGPRWAGEEEALDRLILGRTRVIVDSAVKNWEIGSGEHSRNAHENGARLV